jgi:hypothetical protein
MPGQPLADVLVLVGGVVKHADNQPAVPPPTIVIFENCRFSMILSSVPAFTERTNPTPVDYRLAASWTQGPVLSCMM